VLESFDGPEGVEIGRVVPGDEDPRKASALQQVQHRGALVRADRRQDLEQLPSEARDEPVIARGLCERLQLEYGGTLVLVMSVVEGDRQAFQLDFGGRPGCGRCEVGDLLPPAFSLPVQLEPVRAHVHDPVDRNAVAHVIARPPAHDGDEPVKTNEALQLRARLCGRICVLRPVDDRREHAVEVEEQRDLRRRSLQLTQELVDQRGRGSHPRSIGRCAWS